MPSRIRRLKTLARDHGSLVEAVRTIANATTGAIANDLGVTRQAIDDCLNGTRRYDGVRRALESYLAVPQFTLDGMIPSDTTTNEGKETT